MRRWLHQICGCTVMIAMLGHCGTLEAEQWLTGSKFRSALTQPVGITWAETPIRDALRSLSEAQQIAIFLDRRVDPQLPVSVSSGMAPFSEALRSVLKPYQLGVGYVGSVVYVGPRQTSARIATLAELRNETITTNVALRKAFSKRQAMVWDELTEPRAIVVALADRAGMEIGNDDVIPHDLWPAADLPPLTLSERLTLVLAGFSMNFKLHDVDGKTKLMVTRFPVGVSIERSYPAGKAAAERIQQIDELLPQALIRREGKRIFVQSLLEDHWQLEELFSTKNRATPGDSPVTTKKSYTLKVENKPAGKVLEILADQLGMSLNVAPDVSERAEQLVTFSVKDATALELLQAAANPANLEVEIRETTVRVTAKPSK